MSASHPNHPRLPSEENVSPQSTLVNEDTRFNKNKSNSFINSNNNNTPTLSTSIPLKPAHMTTTSIRTPIVTKSSGPSSKIPTLHNNNPTLLLSSSSTNAAHTSQILQERDEIRLKLDAAIAENTRIRTNLDVERQRNNQLQQQLDQLKDVQADNTTLSEMYQELVDSATKLWDQLEHDRGIISEYDQLTTDTVEENQILRQWVNELGGDPDNDQATWDRLREFIHNSTTTISNNSPSS